MNRGDYRTHYREVQNQVCEKALACGRDPSFIKIIAITKTHPATTAHIAYQEGCRNFGESRVQEAVDKIPLLPVDCSWHFIGSLQRNKVTKALPYFDLIHSIDSFELAEKVAAVSQSNDTTTSILLQVNTSGEATKHGFSSDGWEAVLERVVALPNLRIEGLMTIAPLIEDEKTIRSCFGCLRLLLEKWRPLMTDPAAFSHLSMGMSHDYPIAIEEGATLLRIGTAIFKR